jgi:hypothetical protein
MKIMEEIGQTKCKECGFTNPVALVFHHRDPAMKQFGIAVGLTRRYSYDSLLAEAKKCDVYCSNCHLILHYNEKLGLLDKSKL